MDLNGIPRNIGSGPGGEVFGNRGLSDGSRIASVPELPGMAAQQTGCPDPRHHLRDHPLDQLVFAQESARLFSLAGVLQARFQTRLAYAHTSPGYAVTAAIEGRGGYVRKAKPRAANQVLFRNTALLQAEFCHHGGART